MAVTPDDVRHVADLARLAIPDDKLATYVAQLNGILSHMDALQRVAGAGVAASVEAARQGMALRADDPGQQVRLSRPIADLAPRTEAGFILVPRLATHEESGEES